VTNPTPATTYAVVVGIETYDRLGEIPGPALDAARFAKWLVQHGVPGTHVTCLLSPADVTRADVEGLVREYVGEYQAASKTEIVKVFEATLRQLSGSALIVYWAGHGIELNGQQALYFREPLQVLGVTDLMDRLRDASVKFDRQVFFVDACRQVGLSADLYHLPENEHPVIRPQDALLAVSRGEISTLLNAERTTAFGKALRAELGTWQGPRPPEWPPDPNRLGKAVVRRGGVPAPVPLIYYGPGGSRQEWLAVPRERRGLARKYRGELIRRLSAAAPASALQDLHRTLASHFKHVGPPTTTARDLVLTFWSQRGAPTAFHDAVSSSEYFPKEDDKKGELLDLLHQAVKDDELTDNLLSELWQFWNPQGPPTPPQWALYNAYRRTAQTAVPDPKSSDIYDYAEHILHGAFNDGWWPLFEFLERVARLIDHEGQAKANRELWTEGAQRLRSWCDERMLDAPCSGATRVPGLTRQELNRLRAGIGRESLLTRRHILVQASQDDGTEIKAWEYMDWLPTDDASPDPDDLFGRRLPDASAAEGSDLPVRVAAILSRGNLRVVPGDDRDSVIFEVMLQRKDLTKKMVEDWILDDEQPTLGRLVPVVVRPAPDLARPVSPAAFDRWKAMYRDPPARAAITSSATDTGYQKDGVPCLAVTFKANDDEVDNLVDGALDHGLPAVVWSRNGYPVESLVHPVRDLPDRVLAARCADGHPAQLVLVWNNPHWVPDEEGNLVWRDKEEHESEETGND